MGDTSELASRLVAELAPDQGQSASDAFGLALDLQSALTAPTPPCGGEAVTAAEDRGDGDEPYAPSFYQQLREHAWTALRERKPFQINADGALAIIEQAASDHADNVSLRAENYRLTALVSRLEETIRADGEALVAIKDGPGVACIPDNEVQGLVNARLSARQEGAGE